MERRIIDLPLPRITDVDWDIDWREQSAGSALSGTRKIDVGRLPRWVGSVPQILKPEMVGAYRAARAYARGLTGVFRVAMCDPLFARALTEAVPFGDGEPFSGGALFSAESIVPAVSAAARGAETLIVNETSAPHPIAVGQIMSYADWPFMVVSRAGSGASVTLTVEMPLRVAIPAGGAVHFRGRGLFEMIEPRSGNPVYGLGRVSRPTLTLQEWLR